MVEVGTYCMMKSDFSFFCCYYCGCGFIKFMIIFPICLGFSVLHGLLECFNFILLFGGIQIVCFFKHQVHINKAQNMKELEESVKYVIGNTMGGNVLEDHSILYTRISGLCSSFVLCNAQGTPPGF